MGALRNPSDTRLKVNVSLRTQVYHSSCTNKFPDNLIPHPLLLVLCYISLFWNQIRSNTVRILALSCNIRSHASLTIPSVLTVLCQFTMMPHNTLTDNLEIPGNFSPDRPPILNETICGCKCGCASCICDDSGGDISTTSEFSDSGDGHSIQFEDLVAHLDELHLSDAEQHEGLRTTPSGFFHATPYQIYSVDSTIDPSADGDADASIRQFLHDHNANHAELHFVPNLSIVHTYPRNLEELFEAPSCRPHSPGADSLLANPSEGEHSLMSSMTSSIQLGRHGVSSGYFTIGTGGRFEGAENNFLELTESLQHKHHCGHGVVCGSPLRPTTIGVEGLNSGYDAAHDGLE